MSRSLNDRSLIYKRLRLLKLSLSEYAEKNTFLGLLTSIIPKSTGFPLRTFFGNTRQYTYTKIMNPPSAVLEGGGCTVRSAGS